MDSRGQAYSTFQLLIAAVVAMAILAILIPIIMQVMGLITANPTDETRSLLGSLIDAPGSMRTTKVVSFTPGADLSGGNLAEKVSLGKSQICMSTGEFDRGFECLGCDTTDASQQRLIYTGTTNMTAKIAVVCNKWVVDNGSVVEDGGLAADLTDHKLDDIGGTSILEACTNICKENIKCCAIVLKRA